jgi:Ser-tRNA(Ala) deacylase AlaX
MLEPKKDYHAPMHTAEHILNQTMVRMFNCERFFSHHIERKKSKCDYHFNKALTENEIELIEREVNNIISQNLNVNEELIAYKKANELYNLDKIPGESPEKVRIIQVGAYDACPCIGMHVKNTREIGQFKITTVSFNEGVLRIRYKLQ